MTTLTLQDIKPTTKGYESLEAWHNDYPDEYKVAFDNGWLESVISYIQKPTKPRAKWDFESCHAIALTYNTRGAWQKGSQKSYSAAQRNGWVDACCSHMEAVKTRWTKEMCLEDALRFDSKTEWHKKGNNTYSAAKRNGWFEECAALIDAKKNICVTESDCIVRALPFDSHWDWIQADMESYTLAKDNGWLKTCCAHMSVKPKAAL
ncbi:hypothetical protein VCHA53O466_140165 [Vibrio chagasii]|nr:hypothetical protein VCHA53O466_140165 [Vibrio chagasii]